MPSEGMMPSQVHNGTCAHKSDEEDEWYDACQELDEYQECTEHAEEDDYRSGDQRSSTDAVILGLPLRHAPEGSPGDDGPCLHSSLNDSALDLQEQIRIAESHLASTSGRENGPSSDDASFRGHRAAFYGETETLLEYLKSCEEEELLQHDSHGNTVLHVAVLRQHYDTVQALIDFGYPLGCKNDRKWIPLDEAVSLRDRRMVKLLHGAEISQIKALHKAKRGALLKTMQDMKDVTFKLKWELGSPLFGLLLRRYAPHDVYEVWKKGNLMRVDGSLMGIDDKAGTLIPQWKRGHFSLLFDGRPVPATLLLVDHRKKTVVDLTKEKKKHQPDINDEVSIIMSEGISKTKMKASDFRFTRVKGWLGRDQTERIEGWKTYIYEAAGKMKAVNILKAQFDLDNVATFEEYLTAVFPEDDVREMYIDPLSLRGAPKAMARDLPEEDYADAGPEKEPKAARTLTGCCWMAEGFPMSLRQLLPILGIDYDDADPEKDAKAARTLTGRCWMAEGFPMSLRQLLPILGIVGAANKHLARVAKFLQKYGDMELFPVKLQVPLLFTTYALVSFRNFRVLPQDEDCASEAFYLAPEGYRRKALYESLSKDKKRRESQITDSMADLEEEDFL